MYLRVKYAKHAITNRSYSFSNDVKRKSILNISTNFNTEK